ncbi:MAG: alanine--tRNA ligase [Saprospiraceae bacterium]|nr:alanine--tRNA ligase [Saprospiraceae bacterium]
MESRKIRQVFLDYFEEKSHKLVPSAPIVVKDDPTLMFTNAGMNQFKDYFLGNKKAEITRVADTQKCLRVSGKHNDLEEVGADGYHHTMFEMLGNWSFGDYFKEESIDMAWELLTKKYGLDPSSIYVTVFGGDSSEGLEPDHEAVGYWKKWIAEDRILFFGKKDNFWEMGESGPCGPCSEIHIDLRPADVQKSQSGAALVNIGVPEVMEIWNLVFIQFNRKADGSLEPLPDKHIDTGMGFERLSMVLQKKSSSYDTDIFSEMIHFISEFSGIPYTGSYQPTAKSDMAMRVLVDHIRAIVCTIADGSIPSNTGSGYVIRRILRRAVRYYYSYLQIKDPFLFRLVPYLVNSMGDVFTEIQKQQELIIKVIREEELSFLRTLEGGLKRLEGITTLETIIPGQLAFELYDTFGFPFDLTSLIARENKLEVDETGFKALLTQQKERSRADGKKEYSDWNIIKNGQCIFVGYDTQEVEETELLRWRQIQVKGKTKYQLVLAQTAFYPEGGGQVGDRGLLYFDNVPTEVMDTVKENDLILHITESLPANPEAKVRAVVNGYRRSLIEKNHSATHLLHAALRKRLGNHVSQKGSLVNEDYLRFDFSHFQKLEAEDLLYIEQLVNEKIREDIALEEARQVPIEQAKNAGAMMLFGEKYGEVVRMITFDPAYSIELCGGCHVPSTGTLGYFKIISEGAVAAGIRRIEAVTASKAESYINKQLQQLHDIKQLMNLPADPIKQLESILEENKSLQKQITQMQEEAASGIKTDLIRGAKQISGVAVVVEKIAINDGKVIKNLCYQLAGEFEKCIVVFAFEEQGKPQLMCMISQSLVDHSKDFNASLWIRKFASHIQGGGGGQSFFATAGGKDASGIEAALNEARTFIDELIKKSIIA